MNKSTMNSEVLEAINSGVIRATADFKAFIAAAPEQPYVFYSSISPADRAQMSPSMRAEHLRVDLFLARTKK